MRKKVGHGTKPETTENNGQSVVSPLRKREAWSDQRTFSYAMAKLLLVSPLGSFTIGLVTLLCFPLFYCLYWSLPSLCPCFTIVHCVCGEGEAENFSFIWLVTRQLEMPLNPVADYALCRNYGLWNTCSTWMGHCVISFWGWEWGGDSEYSACGRKDATDIQWTRGQTVAVVSYSPEPTLSFFHIKWAPANRSKKYFSAALLLSVVMSLHLYNRILVEVMYAIL